MRLASSTVNIQCRFQGKDIKCVSPSGGNVTVSVIRAFKLVAHPKHCQRTRHDPDSAVFFRSGCIGYKKKMQKLICMISTEKNSLSHNIVDRFFVFLHPPLWLLWCYFYIFFPLSLFCHISFHLMLILCLTLPLCLAGTDAGIFEVIGTNRKKKQDR